MGEGSSARDAVFAAVRAHVDERERLIESVRCGQRRAVDVISARDAVAQATRLLVVLEAEAGASKVRTRRRLAELGVPELALIGELSDDEAVSVVAAFGGSSAEAGA